MNFKKLRLIKSFFSNQYPYADLVITQRCNMRCKMCDYWKTKGPQEINCQGWKEISGKLKKLGVAIISITGGEPLLKKGILEIIGVLSKDFMTGLNTNGTLINPRMAKKLKESGLHSISLSLDSLTDFHDKQRGVRGTANKVFKAIKLLKDSEINLSIKAVLTRFNENEIEDLIKYAQKKCIKIGFNFYTEMMSEGNINFSLTNPANTIQKLLKLKIKYRNTILSTYYYFKKALDYYQGNLPVCQAGLFYFCVRPNGDIIRCAKLKNEVLANIKTDSVADLKQKLKIIKTTKCNNCWVSCRGEVDPVKLDFFNKVFSYLKYR